MPWGFMTEVSAYIIQHIFCFWNRITLSGQTVFSIFYVPPFWATKNASLWASVTISALSVPFLHPRQRKSRWDSLMSQQAARENDVYNAATWNSGRVLCSLNDIRTVYMQRQTWSEDSHPTLLSIIGQEQREVFDYMFPNPIEWNRKVR